MTFSSDPFQRLTAGATFNRVFTLFFQRWDLFLAISFMMFVPILLMTITIFQFAGYSTSTLVNALNSPSESSSSFGNDYQYQNGNSIDGTGSASGIVSVDLMGSFVAQFVLEYVALLVLCIAGKAAMSYAVVEMYAEREPTWRVCLRRGFSRWCDLFGAVFLVGLCVGFGNLVVQILSALMGQTQNTFLIFLAFLLLVAWLVVLAYLIVSLIILTPVIMVEGKGPIDSIKRCWELSSGNRCYIFCTAFSIAMAYYVVQIILTLIVVSFDSNLVGGKSFLSAVEVAVIMLPTLAYLPLMEIAGTVVYLNIRVQNEGLNLSVLESDLVGEISANKSITYAVVDNESSIA